MIHFLKIASLRPVADHIAEAITEHLKVGERVLWLVAGGSVIPIAVEVAHRLRGQSLENLTVSLTDERHGPPGHPDSNWTQLLAAGFGLPGAHLLPVLTGLGHADTARRWGRDLDRTLDTAGYAIGLFGIGPDGHTSGILPHTPAVTATGTAFAYDGGRFLRISTTAEAIARLDEAIVYAVGEAKWPVLDGLARDLKPTDQPAQLLKTVHTLTVYSDHKGD